VTEPGLSFGGPHAALFVARRREETLARIGAALPRCLYWTRLRS
jgi:hypothetical protein